MENVYLIPANSKKSQLILGFFTLTDILLFAFGCLLTVSMLVFIHDANSLQMLLMLLPALITAFLVTPVLHYHNVLQFIINVATYIFNPRRYYWKGWCCRDESNE